MIWYYIFIGFMFATIICVGVGCVLSMIKEKQQEIDCLKKMLSDITSDEMKK